MATIIQAGQPRPSVTSRFNNNAANAAFIRQMLLEEREAKQGAAAGEAAKVLSELLQSDVVNPELRDQFLKSFTAAGGNAGSGISTLFGIQEARTERSQTAAATEALRELGLSLKGSGDSQREFAADILISPDLKPTTKISILQQSGTLFPKLEGVDLKDIKLFTKEGQERIIRVPETVSDPQKFIEAEMPALVQAGFSTTKPAEKPDEPRLTETQRDVQAIVSTNPTLQQRLRSGEIDQKEARNLARIALRDRDKAIKQLESDLGRVTETGLIVFDATRDRIMFNLARRSITDVIMSGTTDIGDAVSKAKNVAQERFNKLEFLPPELELTPKRAGDFEHLRRVAEFLIDPSTNLMGGVMSTAEDRFNEVVNIYKNLLDGWSSKHTAKLREMMFEPSASEDKSEDKNKGFFDSLFD